jgi:EAL domain-containing protein (putative c-di-GMP-specific phosphodiesterase class I)
LEADWSIRIKDALKEERMEIWLQPVVPLQSKGDAYYEVLLRMRDSQGNIILPGEFLPAAERFGNMMHLDYFVMGRAIALMGEHPTLSLSINLSAKTVTDPTLPDAIHRLLTEHRVAPGRVSFEITETAMIQNLDYAKELITHIKQLGCRFALDDFGSGASSMLYLRDLPIDCLKIDGSFVRTLDKDPINRALVKSMNEVAHVLGKQTVAEYVVNAEVLKIVKELGVDYAQGWHLCEPSPPRRFLADNFNFSVETLVRS